VSKMMTTQSRVGSYGLTTLKNRRVAVDGNEVRFRFTGKSGKQWSLRVTDRRVACLTLTFGTANLVIFL
jgi:DNA topoisomerase IB